METLKKPLSIKVIYWITNITFWFFVAITVLLTLLAGALMFNVLSGDLQLHVGMPVAIDILEQGTLDLDLSSSYIGVEFKEMYGKIHFINTPAALGRIYAAFMLLILYSSLFIFWILRRFINNIYDGRYFDVNNIALLKKISYTLVGIWVFTVFYGYFQYFYIIRNLQFNTIETTSDVQTYPIILLVALFIWVLSHIFQKGVELKNENELTV